MPFVRRHSECSLPSIDANSFPGGSHGLSIFLRNQKDILIQNAILSRQPLKVFFIAPRAQR